MNSVRVSGVSGVSLAIVFFCCGLTQADALPRSQGVWFPAHGPPKGVALVIHGLNLKPAKMDALCGVLAGAGVETLRLSLSGHGFGRLRDVSAAQWLGQTDAGYRAAEGEARRLGVPIFFVGYSLGGLLGEALIATSPIGEHVHFDRAVLLAPSIALRPVVSLVKVLFLFGKGFALPSADRPSYRANRSTPMAAYEALFRLVAQLRNAHFRGTDLPTLVLMRSDDELVSLKGIRGLVEGYRLSHWSIEAIPGRGVPGYAHHLIIDEPSLGAADWQRVASSMVDFLLGPSE